MIVGQSQPTCCYLLHQLSGVVQIRLPPNVAIGAEIGVAAVGRRDHLHAQLQGFRHATAQAFHTVQGQGEISSRGLKDLAPDEVAWASDAGVIYALQRLNDLQP